MFYWTQLLLVSSHEIKVRDNNLELGSTYDVGKKYTRRRFRDTMEGLMKSDFKNALFT